MESFLRRFLLLLVYASLGFTANSCRRPQGTQGPSVQYELQRRRVESTTRGLRDYVSGQMYHSGDNNSLKALFLSFNERISILLVEQQRLWAADGWGSWRGAEGAEVAHLVQRRLHALQHPKHCTQARKLVCKLELKFLRGHPIQCEFGCQLDHLMFCLSLAYGTRRTLVLDSRGWRYHARGWGELFLPLSDNCTYSNDHKLSTHRSGLCIECKRPLSTTFIMPADLADRIARFAGDPAAWWAGQLLAYILRPREHLAAAIAQTRRRIHYDRPIVGLHIRRTDKVAKTEMSFYPIEEYMFFAKYNYWTIQELACNNTAPMRVYLATEDPQVLMEAQRQNPEVEFISDPVVLQSAALYRDQPSAIPGLLTDIMLLAEADFMVCTLSSHVSRHAYTLMQSMREAEAWGAAYSLDYMFHLDFQRPPNRIAVAYHTPLTAAEIHFKPGDVIVIRTPHMTLEGTGGGFNPRTNQTGEFPWFKTKDTMRVLPLPTYDDVPLCDPTHLRNSVGAPPISKVSSHPLSPTPPKEGDISNLSAPDDYSAPEDAGYPDL